MFNSSETALVQIRGVTKNFGSLAVLHGIDLDVYPGEVVCIMGPSGSGKTTLLRCINMLEVADSGKILVSGELIGARMTSGGIPKKETDTSIAAKRSKIGMVFQRFNLFNHLTVIQNMIEAPMHVKGVPEAEARAKALELLERVGLAAKANSYPRQLSGGQQQRVAIVRALAMEPTVMLFDEPTSALDPELVGDVLNTMRELARSGMTMIVVTHEVSFAMEVSSRIVLMESGRIIDEGTPQDLMASSNPRTGTFLSRHTGKIHERTAL